jgi:hypothetical protein
MKTLVCVVAILGLVVVAIRFATKQENFSDERGCVWNSASNSMQCAGSQR